MTFEEWWDANEKQFTADSCHMSEYHMASVVWDASKRIERAACVKICESDSAFYGDYYASKILARE